MSGRSGERLSTVLELLDQGLCHVSYVRLRAFFRVDRSCLQIDEVGIHVNFDALRAHCAVPVHQSTVELLFAAENVQPRGARLLVDAGILPAIIQVRKRGNEIQICVPSQIPGAEFFDFGCQTADTPGIGAGYR